MKLFNNLQELWDQAEYCPICERFCRVPEVLLYPDEIFLPTLSYKKLNDNLIVTFIAAVKNQFNSAPKIKGELKINLDSNKFEMKNLDSNEDLVSLLKKKALYNKYDLEFCIQSFCMTCGESSIYSNDIKLDLYNNSLKEITLDSEIVRIKIDSSEIYDIDQRFGTNQTFIDKCCILDDGSIKRKSAYQSKLLDIDFSDLKKAVNRIKTILVFS